MDSRRAERNARRGTQRRRSSSGYLYSCYIPYRSWRYLHQRYLLYPRHFRHRRGLPRSPRSEVTFSHIRAVCDILINPLFAHLYSVHQFRCTDFFYPLWMLFYPLVYLIFSLFIAPLTPFVLVFSEKFCCNLVFKKILLPLHPIYNRVFQFVLLYDIRLFTKSFVVKYYCRHIICCSIKCELKFVQY